MSRITDDDIKAIMDVDSSLTDLTAFITVANLIVDTHLQDEISDENLLKEIERWLAAHFVAVRDRQPVSQRTGDVSADFGLKLGYGLSSTIYGQQAKLLDKTGKLSALDAENRIEAKIEVLKLDD